MQRSTNTVSLGIRNMMMMMMMIKQKQKRKLTKQSIQNLEVNFLAISDSGHWSILA